MRPLSLKTMAINAVARLLTIYMKTIMILTEIRIGKCVDQVRLFAQKRQMLRIGCQNLISR